VILKAVDIPETVEWYRRIGFEERGSFPDEAPTWCELGRDDLVVQFVSGETPWEGPPALTGCLYVHPASVERMYEQVKDGVVCEWGVEEREWETRELTLRDPNGYYVTFSEPASGTEPMVYLEIDPDPDEPS
jgi:hypothetical protein